MRGSAVFPAQRAVRVQQRQIDAEPSGDALHQHIECALAQFGLDRLTTREQHVVRMILLGMPSKVAAMKLQIAPKTEGVHRRNAYAKLGVNSQVELFRHFLEFLSEKWSRLEETGPGVPISRYTHQGALCPYQGTLCANQCRSALAGMRRTSERTPITRPAMQT